jgi:hypothetical protein
VWHFLSGSVGGSSVGAGSQVRLGFVWQVLYGGGGIGDGEGSLVYQATKGIPGKVNKLATAALRPAAQRKAQRVDEAVLLEALDTISWCRIRHHTTTGDGSF